MGGRTGWTTLLALAMATSGAAGQAQGQARGPEAVFRDMEGRLLDAGRVTMDVQATATGVIEADLGGRLELAPDGTVELRARGTFAGRDVSLAVRTDGGTYRFGEGEELEQAPVPARLKEALVVGLTRMGILHNLAVLTGDAPPDHADGGVTDWVVVDGFSGDGTLPGTVGFAITVAGRPAGTAELEVDADGLPAVRRQMVRFPEGEMRVVERYGNVVVEDGPPEGDAASVPGPALSMRTLRFEEVRTLIPGAPAAAEGLLCVVSDPERFIGEHWGPLPPLPDVEKEALAAALRGEGYRAEASCPPLELDPGEHPELPVGRYVDGEGRPAAYLVVSGPLVLGDGSVTFSATWLEGTLRGGGRACRWARDEAGGWSPVECRSWDI